jgi:glycosyltransferase involved in cell wall biosynthesis
MPEFKTVSLAAPAYNEAEIIESVISEWVTHLRSIPWLTRFEIVICNDGSRDDTGAILDSLVSRWPELRPVHLTVNQGAAAALAQAIEATSLDWVLLIDSDGQFPVENLTRMREAVEREGAQAAIGVRRSKQDSAFARFGSWASGALCNLFHGTHYNDFNCALKLVDGSLLRSIPLEAKGLNYSTEMSSRLLERGVKMVEVEIEHRPRAGGRSSLRMLRGARDRLLFVAYIGFRQLLLNLKILRRLPQ